MSEGEIGPKSISELLGMNFFIPSYQRGYRWTEQQVKDLLNDINEFEEKDSGFYCLQPLVVKKDNDKWIVIDGQQRLTTIFLCVHYFNEKGIGEDKLKEPNLFYETRENSSQFLKSIKIDNTTNIVSSADFDIHKYIDFEYITNAYKTIKEWVISKGNSFVKNNFRSKFQFKTQVVWYEINEDLASEDAENKAIDTFIRINMGKISLTNSELIKALFLQKRDFVNNETAELRQIEIANEWDRIEYTLQNDDFWGFINKAENKKAARIEFIFDLMFAIDAKNKPDVDFKQKYGTDNYATFRFFNEKFDKNINFEKVKKNWNEIKSYCLALEEWFNEPIWYHYIGYLIHCEITIIDIYNDYKDCKKTDFLNKLIAKVKVSLDKISVEKKEENYFIGLSFENKTKPNIRKILLLFNIEYIVKQYQKAKEFSGEIFIRFPFELFKKEKWDIEHIDSFTENEITDFKTQKEWLENSKIDLQLEENLTKQIASYINANEANEATFNSIKSEILKIASEEQNDEETKNTIGNLTLLDAGTNRSYGNALFSTKRRKIIEKDTEGKFIPICTKNVFFKYFDKKGTSRNRWTGDDIKKYQNHIGKTLEQFLSFKKTGEPSNEKI